MEVNKINVLSLFDGMSCGQIALERSGIKVANYFASEIKNHAIKVTNQNYPNTIQLGDITKIDGTKLPKIDLLIGGSPCQDFSIANSVRNGLRGEKSVLFFEYLRLLKECNPKHFLLENVVMDRFNYIAISDYLKTYPVRINSELVSAQYRDRMYWTNIGSEDFNLFGERICSIPQPKDKKIVLSDILELGYTDRQKHTCLNTSSGRDATQRYMLHRYATTGMTTIIFNDPNLTEENGVRYCTQRELEKLQTVPIGYTSILNKSQAGNLLGDGWTVDVIVHIFSYL
jgi:DNA (cytosine-5)-methyltransferase 3A